MVLGGIEIPRVVGAGVISPFHVKVNCVAAETPLPAKSGRSAVNMIERPQSWIFMEYRVALLKRNSPPP